MVFPQNILIVDDDRALVKLVSFHLAAHSYGVWGAKNGSEALKICKQRHPDLVILDVLLPGMDGWEVCRQLRQDSETANIPVIMLSALDGVEDKLKGFDAGTDDYLTKPFSPRELMVRVKRVLARSLPRSKIIRFASLEIDGGDFSVRQNGRDIMLTEKERSIFFLLIQQPGVVLAYGDILDAVWGPDHSVEYGNVDVHIRHLREKIEPDPQDPKLIVTVKGRGYKFEVPA